MLITDLANNIHPKKVEFFERSQLNKLLDEQKLQKSKNFDAKTAVDFGKLSGVNYVFVGSVFILDGTCNFSSKLVDVQTSKILLAKEVSGTIVIFLQIKSQLAEAIAIQLNNPITLDPSYKDQSTALSTINQYGKIVTTMDQGDVDKAEQIRSVFQETTPDFKYFSDIKDEIEKLNQRVTELENVSSLITNSFVLGLKSF
jgi:curli biogenesis system outer membrane secretion channel CsgG